MSIKKPPFYYLFKSEVLTDEEIKLILKKRGDIWEKYNKKDILNISFPIFRIFTTIYSFNQSVSQSVIHSISSAVHQAVHPYY